MTPEPDHIFWVKQWITARRLMRYHKQNHKLAAMNQMIYLTEVFSWYFDHYQIYTIRRIKG